MSHLALQAFIIPPKRPLGSQNSLPSNLLHFGSLLPGLPFNGNPSRRAFHPIFPVFSHFACTNAVFRSATLMLPIRLGARPGATTTAWNALHARLQAEDGGASRSAKQSLACWSPSSCTVFVFTLMCPARSLTRARAPGLPLSSSTIPTCMSDKHARARTRRYCFNSSLIIVFNDHDWLQQRHVIGQEIVGDKRGTRNYDIERPYFVVGEKPERFSKERMPLLFSTGRAARAPILRLRISSSLQTGRACTAILGR